ncbi:MAG TPA: tetratricopeptide repeat protein, partial [Methanocorpusculum sp.]|nr:tetratricopeptide repeat protein [Methanocorpusculum sp.]
MSSASANPQSEITGKLSAGDTFLAQNETYQAFLEYYSALTLTGDALKNNPADAYLTETQLSCLIKCGWLISQNTDDYTAASTYSSAALKLAPASAKARCLHAIICSKMGKSEEALENMLLAEGLDKENSAYTHNLALLYAETDALKSASYKEKTEEKYPGLFAKTNQKLLLEIPHDIKPADHGKSQYALGLKYYVDKEYQTAAEYFRKAADAGYTDAQFSLALCFASGCGVEQDNTKAAEWFKKAAEAGHAEAQFNLARFYENGYGVEKDQAKAIEWYKKAAEQEFAPAQY